MIIKKVACFGPPVSIYALNNHNFAKFWSKIDVYSITNISFREIAKFLIGMQVLTRKRLNVNVITTTTTMASPHQTKKNLLIFISFSKMIKYLFGEKKLNNVASMSGHLKNVRDKEVISRFVLTQYTNHISMWSHNSV